VTDVALKQTQSLALLSHYGWEGEYDGNGVATVLCPFHDDHSPSLNVYIHKADAHCFPCGWHGTVQDIVCQLERVNQIQAMILLSRWSKGRDVLSIDLSSLKEPKRADPELAAARYRVLPEMAGSETKAEDYMLGRGFKLATLKSWHFRVDDDSDWPVVFPIMMADAKEKLLELCWQRRRVDDVDTRDQPKYKWSAGSRFSEQVAGWHEAETLVVCEGYLDMLYAWQCIFQSEYWRGGVRVCSPLTWLMRPKQASQVKARMYIAALDNDEKGEEGSRRLADLLPNVVRMEWDTAAKDPGEAGSGEFMREFIRTYRRGRVAGAR
jgi:hypothetical protein